ncbi:NAD(P)-dependent oxidoreductase [Paenibacillus sp. BC26]|uniref:NAD-dependent epimerase/dehydratase family protein n=1 Tax=Paenibacillus sp. BC26 TaxID=1881032 RepID=UPI0008F31DBC|nr:NAD-dependent epimerase/dehydratase family protein [Paenibacillus sp. BC26]SFS51113.1 GDP-4-dehydro-6-deoxy-D-mannose reductase [Paenibacillus sp. BC26]
MSRPRLLVTGAGGFCGEHACRYFSAAGWEVTAVVRRLPQQDAEERAWLNAVHAALACDLAAQSEVLALIEQAKPEYVLHLAGANAVGASWNDPTAVLQSNVMGTVHVLEGVRRAGTPCRVVVAGSMLRFPLVAAGQGGAERPQPQHPYSLSKTMQVLIAQSWTSLYGMEVVIAEPSNLIGPGRSGGLCALLARYAAKAEQAAASGAAAPAPFRLSSRSEQRDLLDVRDAIRAYELLLRAGESGRIYPVASGVMRTLGEIADAFDALAQHPLQWEIGESQAASPDPVNCEGIIALGWTPLITLEQSLRETLEAARQR